MSSEEHIRATILKGLRAGRTAKEISIFNSIPLRTVYNSKKRFDTEINNGTSSKIISPIRKKILNAKMHIMIRQ